MANDPTYMRRVLNQPPVDIEQQIKDYTGLDSATAAAVLGVHRHLMHGGALTSQHIALMQRAYPSVAHQIPAIARNLNAEPPHTRGDLLIGLLAGDEAVIQGRYHEAGETYGQLQQFASDFHRESIAGEINAKREANTDSDIKARTIEKPEADPLSTRAIIESQWGGQPAKDARLIADAVERGVPEAEAVAREHIAGRAERALDDLKPEADVSTRESVAAAFEWHASEETARDLGYVDQEAA